MQRFVERAARLYEQKPGSLVAPPGFETVRGDSVLCKTVKKGLRCQIYINGDLIFDTTDAIASMPKCTYVLNSLIGFSGEG